MSFLAASPVLSNVGTACLILGFLLCLIYNIQFLIVAARRSVLWLLGCLFVPFVGLFFLFVEPESRKPFFKGLLGVVIIVIGFFLNEDAREDILKELYKSQPNSSESVESPKSTLKQDEDEVRAWQARLQAKKAQLSPTDAAGKAAFDAELKQYMEKLEAVKRARVAAGVK